MTFSFFQCKMWIKHDRIQKYSIFSCLIHGYSSKNTLFDCDFIYSHLLLIVSVICLKTISKFVVINNSIENVKTQKGKTNTHTVEMRSTGLREPWSHHIEMDWQRRLIVFSCKNIRLLFKCLIIYFWTRIFSHGNSKSQIATRFIHSFINIISNKKNIIGCE